MSKDLAQKVEFKAEVKKLLDILVHSLYTSREIFLRELISNSSDALDKLRFQSLKGTAIRDSHLQSDIRISVNEEAKTITITDTGIGMTMEEVINNIGTIAKSGSEEFVKKLSESKEDASNIIGKFGVGFYSVFMIAKEVELTTRSFAPDSKTVLWKSDGLGEFEVWESDGDSERGTSIKIYLRDDAHEFASKDKIKSIIRTHSNFIAFPILVEGEKVNTVTAIWREPKSSLSKEQYEEFYKFHAHDSDGPMETIHVSVDAPIQFHALMFIPKKNLDLFGFSREYYGLDLYARRVLIVHQNKKLLPEYLSFVKGIVDSEDLPLNINRESLQEDLVFQKISSSITTQVLNFLTKLAKDNNEAYLAFWKEHSKIFKLGYTDFMNRDKWIELLRFNSSANQNADELSTLEEYTTRMKKGQKEIYYVVGFNRTSIESDPRLEILRKKGLEVLYLFEPIDEIVLSSVNKYKEFTIKSADSADLTSIEKLPDVLDSTDANVPLSSDEKLFFSSLVEKFKQILGDRVADVKESKRLKSSAACLVAGEDGMSSSMLKMMKMMNQDFPAQKKVLEINPENGLIRNLIELFKKDSDDPFIVTAAENLFETAQLLEGDTTDPHVMVGKINKLLEESSNWYLKTKS